MRSARSASAEIRRRLGRRLRWRRHGVRVLLGTSLLLCLAQAMAAQTPPSAPVLQLQGEDFPELVMRLPGGGADTDEANPECGRIRARRLDELPPDWREVVERLHLDCEAVDPEAPLEGGIVTTATAFLKPGRVQFRRLPVREVRMMDAAQWGDHQYVLDLPYDGIKQRLARDLRGSCQARRDVGDIRTVDCEVIERPDGLYQQLDEITGIWVHPDPDNAAATIYAEAWSD